MSSTWNTYDLFESDDMYICYRYREEDGLSKYLICYNDTTDYTLRTWDGVLRQFDQLRTLYGGLPLDLEMWLSVNKQVPAAIVSYYKRLNE